MLAVYSPAPRLESGCDWEKPMIKADTMVKICLVITLDTGVMKAGSPPPPASRLPETTVFYLRHCLVCHLPLDRLSRRAWYPTGPTRQVAVLPLWSNYRAVRAARACHYPLGMASPPPSYLYFFVRPNAPKHC